MDMHGLPSPQQIDQFLLLCNNSENQPILVHCMQGVFRTGAMVAVYQRHILNIAPIDIANNMPTFGPRKRWPILRDFILKL